MLGHAGLMIKAIGLPGYGRREGHGQPVLELGILAYDLDAQGMRIKRLHSLETFSAQVQPAACSVRLRLRPQVLVDRSEEHTSELQSLMRISYAVFCLKKKTQISYILHRRQHT